MTILSRTASTVRDGVTSNIFRSFQAVMNVQHLAPSVAGRRARHNAIAHGTDTLQTETRSTITVAVFALMRSTARLIAA